MTFVLALICLALATLAGWLLRRTLVRAKAQNHARSIVTPGDGPFGFRATVTLNAMALLVFAAATAALLYRAIAPLTVPMRAQTYYPSRAVARRAEGMVLLHCPVWTAPCRQGVSELMRRGRERSCVRPVDAALNSRWP